MHIRLLCISFLIVPVYPQDLAQSLGLKSTWKPSLDTDPSDPKGGDWNYVSTAKATLGNIKIVTDPLTNSTQKVYSVFYPKDSYSPQKSSQIGGVEFFAQPFAGQNFDRVLLSYEVGFPANFPWQKGGKLPGIFGGDPKEGCTGGEPSDGNKCFSARLMWREQGVGEVYAYIPNSKDLCSNPRATCRDKYGVSLGQGVSLNLGVWNQLQLYVQLNSPGKSDGDIKLYVNGEEWLDMPNILLRNTGAIAIDDILFSTFFGGGDASYATPIDTYTYYRNIQFSVGDPIQLTSNSPNEHRRRDYWTLIGSVLVGFYYLG